MNISITEKEVNAIDFSMEQVRESLEGATSEEYIHDAREAIIMLNNILRKYHCAREKANDLNKAKKFIRSRNGWIPPTKLDRMARLLIKRSKENEV